MSNWKSINVAGVVSPVKSLAIIAYSNGIGTKRLSAMSRIIPSRTLIKLLYTPVASFSSESFKYRISCCVR